ncbi:glutathione S-transferase family protein [Paracoccus chinensis]|uniref:Glutathione S-transferase n=1 Tax=Paracoccus chinensis TaxID=525640 RepID=A0A1G9K9L9_9RHOB|nr:glutathione S-transferase family protein [Paracoccus chinensis]SDL46600.1 glutathione S-transferase [Paracoccus chinensis]
MYKVIGYGGTRAFRLLWMLEELHIPHRHDRVMPFTQAARDAVPGGRLPALELRDGTILQDSTAILSFLADRYGALTHPPGSVERAVQDGWTHRVGERIDGPLMNWTTFMQGHGTPPVPEVRTWVADCLAEGFAAVAESLPDTSWVTGEEFTIADIVLGHCLHWAERYQTMPEDARLRAYLARVRRRPAYLAADSS